MAREFDCSLKVRGEFELQFVLLCFFSTNLVSLDAFCRSHESDQLGRTVRCWAYLIVFAQSAGAAEYTDCISAEGLGSSNECPDMTLNNLMVKLQ